MQRRIWREGHRRSPRICALDVKKAQVSRVEPVSSKRPRQFQCNKRKKLFVPSSPQEPSSSYEQDDIQPTPENLRKDSEPTVSESNNTVLKLDDDQATTPGQLHVTPDKRLLEFIVDILQRRDTHEIFAEPVDPNEVEDYYEIIKEPMDFGTMRAKLHEGMYHSLEQFEHDAFLISKNAMHFNSSGTIYFRQARVIDGLAKKVFHVLKTDPANFEMEFSGTRRRSTRKVKSEVKSSNNGSSLKPATNSRSSSMAPNISRKSLPISSSSKLNIRTTPRVFPVHSSSSHISQSNMIEDEMHMGEVDRRCSYKPWRSVFSENCSVVSPNSSKVLMLQDVGYSESLMRFAKGLGPVAQMVAKRKLREATDFLNSQMNNNGGQNSRFGNFSGAGLNMEDEKVTKVNQDLPFLERSSVGQISKGKNVVGGQNQEFRPILESIPLLKTRMSEMSSLREDRFLQGKRGLMSANLAL